MLFWVKDVICAKTWTSLSVRRSLIELVIKLAGTLSPVLLSFSTIIYDISFRTWSWRTNWQIDIAQMWQRCMLRTRCYRLFFNCNLLQIAVSHRNGFQFFSMQFVLFNTERVILFLNILMMNENFKIVSSLCFPPRIPWNFKKSRDS